MGGWNEPTTGFGDRRTIGQDVSEHPVARAARATGLIQREGGKLKADALFWSFAIGFLSGNYRILEEFRQEYIDTFGGSLRYSSFHDWFMPATGGFNPIQDEEDSEQEFANH